MSTIVGSYHFRISDNNTIFLAGWNLGAMIRFNNKITKKGPHIKLKPPKAW